MRRFSHLTPRYIIDRVAYILYEKSHSEYPWLTQAANTILDGLLIDSDRMLEFGSGRSTIWFSKRVKSLVSVEHDKAWYEKVKEKLKGQKISNVDYRLASSKSDGSCSRESYIGAVDEFREKPFDVVLVDGLFRSDCALLAVGMLESGGILIIDNVNRYLPSKSRAPESMKLIDGPIDDGWVKFAGLTKDWRHIWTTNGLSDTAFFFKP
ncbi:hypothetical protein NKH75_32760 [Mesorhizobium sp. M0984]|uniref:hypothetical protein n=1 Tax=Mesorhizobium sp. M0984 TaxID=2957041 RepID=UPI00333C0853